MQHLKKVMQMTKYILNIPLQLTLIASLQSANFSWRSFPPSFNFLGSQYLIAFCKKSFSYVLY